MSKEAKIIFSITAVIVVGVIILIIMNPKQTKKGEVVDVAHLVTSASHMKGKADAKVTIVEFGDYQCPACGAAEPVFEKVIAEYKDNQNVNFVFRNYPLQMHQNAMIAAEAAEAGAAQGKFWEMHDMLYTHQAEWSENKTPIIFFTQYATTLGLDVNKFKSDVESVAYDSVITADKADGDAVNVQWTPTIFINGELQLTTPTFEQFKTKIDTLLAKQ